LKIIEKNKWLHTKYKENITEYGEILGNAELETLPLSNLMMMDTRFSSMKKSKINNIDLRNGDRGDSQP
jgi:hypothetical protein